MHRDPHVSTDTSNAALMARRRAALPAGLGQTYEVFVERAENAEVWDVEGRRYIDFAGGIAVLNTGHRHPKIVEAVKAQLDQHHHTCFQVLAYENYVELAERLIELTPGDFAKKAFFLSSGAEAVENAIKIARAATKRQAIIAFGGGFHGRTMMGMALTGKVAPYKTGFGPFPAEIYHAKFPNPLHGVSVEDAIASIEAIFKYDVEAARVAAIILEPVQGEGGFYVAPIPFVRALRQLCDQHGIVLIADEVQTGAGRTGTWLACEQWVDAGVGAPDIVTMAKSMGGGFPISAVIGRAELMDAPGPGGLGGTYAGSPLACAAALAVLDVFKEERLLERSQAVGARLTAGLHGIASRLPCIQDVRGQGAMIAIELFTDGDLSRPDADLTRRTCAEALRRGLVLLSCGVHGNVIRILVPLTACDALLDEGLAVLEASLATAVAGK
ncbi:4-aminobutyrate aminotransferase/(S)-3-amino-2-methylpropionate transaminase [Sphaerotilus hippei]|uniref:4-aminobutyrate aminotransferase/(S)-3-amino-2-methylpropionate transaminase n=1 Tax=Sphaerotilus hippei TaxID=744406 RepID=A0A318H3E6_9BURK|nr:4-aminobutyrate--2-oxoglutarate transaminase [Sphaerotilus hippei]PXW98066.1 4-aminobutyrate aminotransferase/(S)-3-amino-2-methylpropionate transaminase [Sphaerotilus hippei]